MAGPCWHADEKYIKIKGYWLWIAHDKCQVLAWHISKKRIPDARKVLREAMRVAGKRPEKIITDGLQAYAYAIKKKRLVGIGASKRKDILLTAALAKTHSSRGLIEKSSDECSGSTPFKA